MQYYDITVKANGTQFPIAAAGVLLRYLNGSAGTGDNTLKVRVGNTGQTFLLQPGQSIRLAADAPPIDTWYLSSYAMTDDITGQVLIGDGDFIDNRISGTVDISGTVKTQETGLEYTGSFAEFGVLLAVGVAHQVIAPAANVNGVVVHQCQMKHLDGGGGVAVLIAKASAPANITDGDVLLYGTDSSTNPAMFSMPILIPPGKGLYFITNATETGSSRSLLYTVL